MVRGEVGHTAPRRRADAEDNRNRLLQAARVVFEDQATPASLNKVAQRAGVGPGTLYRHFPTLQVLLVALIREDIERLCATGRDLLAHSDPDEALTSWLRSVAMHATAMRGLVAIELVALPADGAEPALAECHNTIRATGAALLARAQREGTAPPHTDILDLLKLANAIAWTQEQNPHDPHLLDRLIGHLTTGLRAAPERPEQNDPH